MTILRQAIMVNINKMSIMAFMYMKRTNNGIYAKKSYGQNKLTLKLWLFPLYFGLIPTLGSIFDSQFHENLASSSLQDGATKW